MLYTFAKILMTGGLRFFYRHIYVSGLENIPSSGPAIIIANHNSSLMDAALLGVLLKRRAWFYARGDVFVNKPVQKILWWLHMLPVHGYQAGRHTLGANRNSFSAGQQILSANGIIVFFPESSSHTEHRLLPFRKGVFRLAFDTANAQQFAMEIPIIPVGITYEHPVAGRTTAAVHAGKPILLGNYKDEYLRNPAAALLHICKDAQCAVASLVLHVQDAARLQTAEQYLTTCRNNHPPATGTWTITSGTNLALEQTVCNTISNMDGNDFEEKKQKAAKYFSGLSAAGLTDDVISENFSFPLWKHILVWLGFPLYVLGVLLNGLPVLLAKLLADKKVYRKDFYSWIFVACYSFFYFCWLVALLIGGSLASWKYAALLLLLAITTGIFAYAYKGWMKQYSQWRKRLLSGISNINSLKAMRNSL